MCWSPASCSKKCFASNSIVIIIPDEAQAEIVVPEARINTSMIKWDAGSFEILKLHITLIMQTSELRKIVTGTSARLLTVTLQVPLDRKT